MLFDSYIFIFAFLPVCLLLYHLLTRFRRAYIALIWLVIASLFFYAWWNPKYLALLLFSITVNYGLGYGLFKRSKAGQDNQLLLFVGIFFNLLLIGYFKYTFFLVSNFNTLLAQPIPFEQIILPLGISFFTFQKIAFLVDASRGEIQEYRFFDYCLFVTFFPQLIAGPIVQHKHIIPQFANHDNLKVSAQNISIGMTIFIIGLFKKIALADSVAPFANIAFNEAANGVVLSFGEAWAGALAYALQLYFDFSGYTDMAIGLAYLFGIKLPINFYSPYQAKNIIDFWRRWHMTLSSFLRDYLYIPLGGSRKGPLRRHANLMMTMLIGGLWHGANWTFVLWGGLHGLYLVFNHTWQWACQHNPILKYFEGKGFCFLGQALTFMAVVVAWVPFRANNIQVAQSMLHSMFSMSTLSLPQSLVSKFSTLELIATTLGLQCNGVFYNAIANWYYGLVWIAGLMLLALFAPNTTQIMQKYVTLSQNNNTNGSKVMWKPSTIWAAGLALMILISMMLMSEESEFLYFQF